MTRPPLALTARITGEPECCGTPMVHNSWSGEWECADAYFTLEDDGVIDWGVLLVDVGRLDRYQTERYFHWRGVRVPDGWNLDGPPWTS